MEGPEDTKVRRLSRTAMLRGGQMGERESGSRKEGGFLGVLPTYVDGDTVPFSGFPWVTRSQQ